MTGTLSGRSVLWWVVGFFAVVISVNVYFIVLSVTTFSGEDEQKPYLQGVEYNTTLAHRATQRALGWRATISASRQASGAVTVTVKLNQADGAPEDNAVLDGELRHPADENRDQQFHFAPVGHGLYQAVLKGVGAGAWDMIVTSGAKQPPFEASRRLWVP